MSRPPPMNQAHVSHGCRLVSPDGRELSLTSAELTVVAHGGIARTVLRQRFENPFHEPLRVTYQLPLPADGAVSGYAFTVNDVRIVGEVDRRERAKERFEQALLEGRSASLVEQDRSSLFTQELGNIPARTDVLAEVTVDQKLAFLPEGAWEFRFPTVVAPRYLGEPGRVEDADRLTVDVLDRPASPRLSLQMEIREPLADGASPESCSHALRVSRGVGKHELSFADEACALDRDVVVRWNATALEPGATLAVARPARRAAGASDSAFGLLTLLPPSPKARLPLVARDLIVLLDTSGSMAGEPLAQAVRVVSALVDTLRDQDQLELCEFSSSPRRWKRGPVAADASNRKDALAWLGALRASGGTEMRSGILAALDPLRDDAQRQVVLVTDGLIGSEAEVLKAVFDHLPPSSRVHTVGVGSAVNRSLTGPLARAGRGAELVVALGEDPERVATRLCARTCAPLVTGLEVGGSALRAVAPRKLPDLFLGAPAQVSLELAPEGGELWVRGTAAFGPWESKLRVEPCEVGEGNPAVSALFGREAVEDWELSLHSRTVTPGEADRHIEALGLSFQLATRLTSWVAVSHAVTVDPRAPGRAVLVPQELPHGLSAEGLGLRPAAEVFTTASGLLQGGRARALASSAPAPRRPAPRRAARKDEAPPNPAAPEPTLADGSVDSTDEERAEYAAPRSARPPPAAPAQVSAERKAQALAKALAGVRARVKLLRGRELVILLELERPLAWEPPATVRVAFASGGVDVASVDPSRSTGPCSAGPGMVLRLCLSLPTERAERAVTSLRFSHGGEDVEVVL